MSSPAVTIEALPAAYGDCLLIQCPVGKRTWRLLIDTGPDETFPQLKARLAKLPADSHGKRHIDLFIVTHIDHDHIGGAGLLLNDRSLGLTFGDIWFNARPQPAARGVAEGVSLAQLLGARDQALPWNKTFRGKAAVTDAEDGFVELRESAGAPRITLLSPTPARLADLFKVWDKELLRLRNKESDLAVPTEPASRGAGGLDIEALAAKVTATDHSVPNGSGLAILLEHQGASMLLAADAHPTVLVPALKALATHRGVPLPMQVDVFKLSHHGSRANVTVDLLQAVQAQHYIVSTNGAIFNHPDDEAIARVIVDGGIGRKVWFNYRTDHNAKWAAEELQRHYGYSAKFPEVGQVGVTVALDGQKSKGS